MQNKTDSLQEFPVICVGTPTYNRAYCIAATIESVLAQTYPHWHLIIVDDGSTDDTAEVVGPYARANSRIQYLRLNENGGIFRARNCIIDNLPDEVTWIAQLDSDDVFVPEAIETMVARAAKSPEARNLKFGSRWADGPHASQPLETIQCATYRDRLLGEDPWGEWVNFTHRCFFDQGMRFDERLRRTPSVSLHLRVYKIAPAYHFPEVVRIMCRDNLSITRPAEKDTRYYLESVEVNKVFFEQYGEDLLAISPTRYAKKLYNFAMLCELVGLPREQWPKVLRDWRFPLTRRWPLSIFRSLARNAVQAIQKCFT